MDTRATTELIGSLYEAALDDDGIEEFLTTLKAKLRANNTTLALFDDVTGTQLYTLRDLPIDVSSAYVERIAEDTRVTAALAMAPGSLVVRDDDLTDPRVFRRSSFYRDVIKPYDCDRFLAFGCFSYSGCDFYALGNRSINTDQFNDNDRGLLWTLMPHMERSLRIRFRLRARSQLPANPPTLLVDHHGQVAEINASAREIERKGDCFRVIDGYLRLRDPANALLWQLIQDACGIGEPLRLPMVPIVRIAGDRETYQLIVYPTLDSQADLYRKRSATVCVLSIDSVDQAVETNPWGLTVAEQEVLTLFVSGHELRTIAEQRSRSIHTVRTQLKSILRKTGARSQVELVRMLQGESR